MQQNKKTKYKAFTIGITGAVWVAGLLIASSDSPYMPWLNGIGLVLFSFASILLDKLFRSSRSIATPFIPPGYYQKSGNLAMTSKKRCQRINIRYATGI